MVQSKTTDSKAFLPSCSRVDSNKQRCHLDEGGRYYTRIASYTSNNQVCSKRPAVDGPSCFCYSTPISPVHISPRFPMVTQVINQIWQAAV